MSFFDSLDEIFKGAADWGTGVGSITDLQTVDGPTTFALSDGSLMTLLRVGGALSLVGEEEFSRQKDAVYTEMSSHMAHVGHSVAIHFLFDPFNHDDVDESIETMRLTAKQIGFELNDVLDDWSSAIKKYTRSESIYMALYTRITALPPSDQRAQKKEIVMQDRSAPSVRDTQRTEHIATGLRDQHESFVQATVESLKKGGVDCSIMEVHDAVYIMRSTMHPKQTSKNWRALLPGDTIPRRYMDDGRAGPAEVMYPSLHRQIFRDSILFTDARTIQCDGIYHRPVMIDVPPQNPSNFDTFFSRMCNADYKWRFSIHLDGDGLGMSGWKDIFASVFYITSSINRQYTSAKKEMKHLVEIDGEKSVRLRITTDVMSDDLKIVNRGANEMSVALQGWGSADTECPIGASVMQAMAATLPGVLSTSPANSSCAPLSDVVKMLPFVRPASIWKNGLPFRTRDGKLFPFTPGSSMQTSFIDLGIGPMGYGKSVALNAYNLSFILMPGATEMPYLSIIDVGPSSSGLVSLVRDGLPEGKKHLAVFERLRMDPSRYAINPFDTPLGCFSPITSHSFFLANFLALLATPLNATAPPDGIAGIARLVIEMAYDEFSPRRNAKLYIPNTDPSNPDTNHLDKEVIKMGMPMDEQTTWWDLVDFFFSNNMLLEAEISQRYAVPLLGDVASMSRREQVIAFYGREVADRFWRACIEANTSYPILAKPTRFSIGSARIVALDLDEVSPKGGAMADRQTAVMYMIARHVAATRFFVMAADVSMMPEKYRDYHLKRIEIIRTTPKRLAFDEFHRVGKNSSVSGQIVSDIETAARESRKWNLHIGLYSQDPNDIPPVIAGFATSVFIFGVGGRKSAEAAKEAFSLSDTATTACVRHLAKPGRAGSTIVAKFQTDKGEITQFLMSTLGSVSLWGFSSTTEDTKVRTFLYNALPTPAIARRALADLYPGGSIKDAYEVLRIKILKDDILSEEDETIKQLLIRKATSTTAIDALDMISHKVLRYAEKNLVTQQQK